MKTSLLTQVRLRELLAYDPTTGQFTWTGRERKGGMRIAGALAGSVTHGYVQIQVDGVLHKAHRLAFLFMTGEMPLLVDHINGVRDDNHWANLRPATATLNAHNRRQPQRNNRSTGLLGVNRRPNGRFQAVICTAGRQRSLGVFATPEEAQRAYLSAKRAEHQGVTV